MSYAAENPVYCAKRGSGCTASYPGSRHAAIEAQQAGWFHSRQTDEKYCPDHVPGWVAGWLARRRHDDSSGPTVEVLGD